MSYIGGGLYYCERCPLCGELMWNGQCENRDCHYHWHPMDVWCRNDEREDEE